MSEFTTRYSNLNKAQQQAVDTIDGPLLVIAGPGTGKTELLSMRVANILKQTDSLPQNILCLTFTDSGANAMRERLADIIGPDAYKVAIHTFHSFGTEIINQNNQFFYHGADFQSADELSQYELLTAIFDELDYDNPLASKLGDRYTHLSDTMRAISELKQAGLTSDELLAIINANETVLDAVEHELTSIFSGKISTTMLARLVPLAQKVAAVPEPTLPAAITPLARVLALSMAHAFDAAVDSGKTTPITAWRNQWLEKNADGEFVFKDRKRYLKLRALSHIYYAYLTRMEQAGLYDYDDMILNVIHGMSMHKDLKYNLQEQFHYILVDEFQDTNLAQLRILFELTDIASGDAPNIMAVGDDDQAIYSFQGADVNNIHRFTQRYPSFKHIVLTDNYRSASEILTTSRDIIQQGAGRLETTMGLSKQLTPHHAPATAGVTLTELASSDAERSWLTQQIADRIASGTTPSNIAVLARRHSELVALVPHLIDAGIPVSYERRENVLEFPAIQALVLLATVVVAIASEEHDEANAHLPELLSHPMFGYKPESIWRLSLASHRNSLSWLEVMLTHREFKLCAEWLITQSALSAHESLEQSIDHLIGVPSQTVGDEIAGFNSPFYEYYFGDDTLQADPGSYLSTLEALRTIRDKLREYHPHQRLRLSDFLEYIRLNQELGTHVTTIRRHIVQEGAVNLMTAHKAKGLEFDTVYIAGAVDSVWGERVRGRSRLINYPANLPLIPNGGNYDERLRLFYVAVTRAKRELAISYATTDDLGRAQLRASFLTGTELMASVTSPLATDKEMIAHAELSWHDHVRHVPQSTMRELLAPQLAHYKLSITHLNNFIDLSRGGPTHFLLHNLLRFPQAMSASANYGSAIHRTLQKAHNHLTATGERRPVEDVLGDFVAELDRQQLQPSDALLYSKKGAESLGAFLRTCYPDFVRGQKTELSFANQGVVIEKAILTGSLDVLSINGKHLTITDYKTGKPSRDWKGKTEWEKIKLHKYRQQLMFYQLLCQHSRDYSKYEFEKGILQFVEPDATGKIHALEARFTELELAEFTKLIGAVWQAITTLDFPDVSEYEPTYKGILQFEADLVDKFR
ncbi:MAG: ATP-dependent helicase [Candidatus Saccharimonas sp.]|nr:ATP-dependent helicase [Candidatus Saccharimonas sp.]